MFNRIFILLMVGVILGIALLPEISVVAAQQALKKENQKTSWAPTVAYQAGVINMRMWRYQTGRVLLDKAQAKFPNQPWGDEALFQIGLCYEKTGEPQKAIAIYQSFARQYPHHPWTNQALKRAENLKANQ